MSKAAATFIMADEPARLVFDALGLECKAEGVIVVERMPGLLQLVAQRMDEGRAQAASQAEALKALNAAAQRTTVSSADMQALGEQLGASVGLHQRLVPLRDMLQRAVAKQQPIVWQASDWPAPVAKN